MLVLFAFSQTTWMPGQTRESRVYPVELLFMRVPVLLLFLGGVAGALTFVTLYYVPLYLEFARVKFLLFPSETRISLLFIPVWCSCPLSVH